MAKYTRLTPPLPSAPPLIPESHSTAPRTTRHYPSRSSKNPEETVISVDADAPPLGNLEDKLEDVLPHVPVSRGVERLLGEVIEGMARDDPGTKSAPPARSSSAAKHTSLSASDLAANSSTVAGSDLGANSASPVPKPASLATLTGTTEADKKRSNDEDVGVTAKRPKSCAADVASNATNLEGFYFPEAKELRALLEKHQSILAGESVLLEKLQVPPADNTSTQALSSRPEKEQSTS